MSRLADKARLRNTLRKLNDARAMIADTGARAEAAQEALDFLAMACGLKPVFLLGRGVDDPHWIRGALQTAIDRGLTVIEGPYWDAMADSGDLPGWYVDRIHDSLSGLRAFYICRARAVAAEVETACRTGAPTIAEEARLLGYPDCCVAAHYARALDHHRLQYAMYQRMAGGDPGRLQDLLRDGVRARPETESENAALQAAMAVSPAPFTSVNRCVGCARQPDAPAMRLSARYRALAEALDGPFAREIERGF